MTVTDYGFEAISADHAAMSLLAGGDDLFDLTQLAGTVETVPAYTATAMDTGGVSVLAVADHSQPGSPGEAMPAQVPVSENAPSHPDTPASAKTAAEATVTIHGLEDTVLAQLQHPAGAALVPDDVFGDLGGDLASFQTAAGGSHAPMGSGMFTPFSPAPLLDGLHALAVLTHD